MSSSFVGVLWLSLILKAVLAIAASDLEPRYDERQFLRFAQEWIQTGSISTLWRAPGYQWFMGLGLWVGGGNVLGIRLLQVLVSTGSAFLVYRIGRRQWNERVGLVAGALVAFYPSQIAFSHLIWSETLYGFFFLVALERLLATERDGGLGTAVMAGLALAAASLTRSTGLGLLVVSVLWIFWRRRGSGGPQLAGTVLLAAVCAIAPWSINASVRAGCPVVVDLNGPFNLWSGNNPYTPADVQGLWGVGLPVQNGSSIGLAQFLPDAAWRQEVPWRMAQQGIPDRFGCAGARWYQEQALAEIAGQPAAFVERIPLRIAGLWSPDFFLSRHLLRDWYGALPAGLVAFLVSIAGLASVVALMGGAASLAALPPSRFRSLSLLWVLSYLGAHALTFGLSRMHFPLVPVLLLAVSAFLFSGGGRVPTPNWSRLARRGGPWALLVCLAWLWIAPTWVGLYLVPGPRHPEVSRILGAVRGLPVPGTRYSAWMLANVEASRGDVAEADRILSEPAFVEHPWSLYLRGTMAPVGPEGERLLAQALERDPHLYPAWVALGVRAVDRGSFDEGIGHLAKARELRPWDREIYSALERARALRMEGAQP